MKSLPPSDLYEQELQYWPYRESLIKVEDIICTQVPENGEILDLMCGPGYLLGKIHTRMPSFDLTGVDIDRRYVKYAREKYRGINFEQGDVLSWMPKQTQSFDAVICTGALHHIPYEKQASVIERMASMIRPSGFALISDCYISDYSNETQRKVAAAKLGYEYVKATIENGAPDACINVCIDVIHNDVLMDEFKTSLKKRMPIFNRVFDHVQTIKTWPKNDFRSYGDYVTILRQ